MNKCEIGKCTNKYEWHHYNYVKGIHIKYCQKCWDTILFNGVIK